MSPLSLVLFAAVRRAALLCLPFAAVLAAGVTLSPHVAAQYPGGYPGGPAPGWHPLKPDGTLGNDPLNTSPFFNLYDWTRLDIVSSGVTNGQAWGPTSGKFTSGQTQGSTGGVGPGPSDSTARSISGSSTIKFQWVPPLNATGQPDGVNFPAPPLFVLGSITPSGNMYGPAGVTGSGGLADGWGWSVPLALPCSVVEPAHRKALAASLAASGTPAVITLSPSASITMAATMPSEWGGGGVYLSEYAYPITLSAPNPLTNPLLGDGTNQEVYDTGTPGKVNVPTIITLPGASTDDTTWLVNGNHVDVVIVPAISGQEPHTWSAFGSDIGHGPGYFTFDGLPTVYNGSVNDPNSFGNHLAVMKVDGKISQFAHFQTFFDGGNTTSNWPNANSLPNWFYYYNQIYPFNQFNYNGQSYVLQGGYDPTATYTGGAFVQNVSQENQNPDLWTYTITLGSSVPNYVNFPAFEINNSKRIGYSGNLMVKGIHEYERIVAHELAHIKLWLGVNRNDLFAYPIVVDSQGNQVNITWWRNNAPAVDTDGDGIPDDIEIKYGLDPNDMDSTRYFTEVGRNFISGSGISVGDQECLAEIAAMGEVINHRGDWMVDWSSAGLQYGPHPTDSVPNNNGPFGPFWPYEYVPNSAMEPDTDHPPATVLKSWQQILDDIASK